MGLYGLLAATALLARPIMLIMLAVNCALLIADIIKRRLLSRSVIWYFTMIFEPMVITACIGLIIGRPLSYIDTEVRVWSVGLLLDILIAMAASATALTILVRGHIRIIDKRLPVFSECSPERLIFVSVRRLVCAGGAGTAIATFVFMLALLVQLPTLALFSMMFLAGILCPVFIYFSIIAAAGAGIEMLVLSVLFLWVIIEYLTILNGCFRYIFFSDKSKGRKAILAILCVVFPIFGFVYGFYTLHDFSKNYRIDK